MTIAMQWRLESNWSRPEEVRRLQGGTVKLTEYLMYLNMMRDLYKQENFRETQEYMHRRLSKCENKTIMNSRENKVLCMKGSYHSMMLTQLE